MIDLHCDLLEYVVNGEGRTVLDPEIRCSLDQLRNGEVQTQVLAIFTETISSSIKSGMQQAELYQEIRNAPESEGVELIPAIENASGFCDENESLQDGLKRFDQIIQTCGVNPLYVGLTWSTANRFGGGNESKSGLSDDGRRVIEKLAEKNIALDFSHMSDWLAEESLNFLTTENLPVRILASHIGFRSVQDDPRNLPDFSVKEIQQRNGVIGIFGVSYFLGGDSLNDHFRHIQYGIENGLEDLLVSGYDYFYAADMPGAKENPDYWPFLKDVPDASYFGALREYLSQKLTDPQLKKFLSGNAERFLAGHRKEVRG